MEQYEYQPLPSSTSIRLIKSITADASDHISCSLVVADISSVPEYIALSYPWGDARTTTSLVCNGKAISVTINLRDALSVFCNTPVILWADAICINQKDTSEKNQQLSLMAQIYSKAANVSAWLGPDIYDEAAVLFQEIKWLIEGLGMIHSMDGQFKRFDEETGDLHWTRGESEPHVSALPRALVSPDEEEKARLQRFFRLPWFSRTWVIQEVGLASDAVVIWGKVAFEWNPLGVAAMFLRRHCRALLESLNLEEEITNVYHLYTTFSPFIPLGTFLQLLIATRRFKAQDPRDKIFALLSHPTAHTISITSKSVSRAAFEPYLALASHFVPHQGDQWMARQNIPQSCSVTELPQPLFPANYHTPVQEVYENFARDIIRRTRSLEVLVAVQHSLDNSANLPAASWVPRWDHFINTTVFGLVTSIFTASTNRDAIVTSSPLDVAHTLTVRGSLVTRIVTHTSLLQSPSFDLPLDQTGIVGPSSPSVQQLWDINPIARTWLKNFTGIDQESYPRTPTLITADGHTCFSNDDRFVFKAYASTWVAGGNLSLGGGDSNLQADFNAYWNRLFWGTEGDPERGVNSVRDPVPDQDHLEAPGKQQERWKRYRDQAAHACHSKRFFSTKKGFFGLGPGALRDDDFVAILLGADVPFVLREVLDEGSEPLEERRKANKPIPMDTKFQLVGECFVEGLMFGGGVRGATINRDITLI